MIFKVKLLLFALAFSSSSAQALFLDGKGSYGLLGETRFAPGMAKDRGKYQVIRQSFRLLGEARLNDNSSVFLEFRLFPNWRTAYLGDTVYPATCDYKQGGSCQGAYQDVSSPGYKPYEPQVTQVYARYAFDYGILEAGRRSRDWGLGIFLNAGDKPFASTQSVYDGISCLINMQNTQTLSFSFGYDKLAETGTYVRQREANEKTIVFGASNPSDDIDQYYISVQYDDRNQVNTGMLAKQVGIYAANLNSRSVNHGGSSTLLSFVDIYSAFFLRDFIVRNEVLFRMGKTADPHTQELGGAVTQENGNIAVNKMQALALAGNVEWFLSQHGSLQGPSVFQRGNLSRHVLFFEYAYAPGDSDGYYSDSSGSSPLSMLKRSPSAKAYRFSQNYNPALSSTSSSFWVERSICSSSRCS